jgi:hypothetical protein
MLDHASTRVGVPARDPMDLARAEETPLPTTGTQRDRSSLNPVAVALGCVATLALASFGLDRAADSLSWTYFTLATDLRLAAVCLWTALLLWAGLASVSDRARRAGLPLSCLLGRPPCPRVVRWVWVGLILLAAAAAAFPGIVPTSRQGFTLRVGQPWRGTAATDRGRLVTRLSLGDTAPPWVPAPHVVLSGWIFAPVSGDFHFELAAHGDALLEVDGAPFLGVNAHGAEITREWATDETGARRASGELRAGFHRVTLFYRPGEGPAGVRLRWTPPHVDRPRSIPVRYLLPDGTPPETLRWRGVALMCRRIGLAAVVVLVALPLSGGVALALTRGWAFVAGARAAGGAVSRGEGPRRA